MVVARGKPGIRAGLNRTAILAAALRLADERGTDGVSMRAVADAVGVTPMALYPHVGTKAELLDGLVEAMLVEFLPEPSDVPADWRDRMREIAGGAREMSRRHPAVFTLLFARPAVTPGAVGVVDLVYGMLLDAGVSGPEVPRLERLVTTFCLGYAMSEVSGRFGGGRVRTERGDGAPAHQRLADVLAAPVDWDAEYAADVEDLIAVIERVSVAARSPGVGATVE